MRLDQAAADREAQAAALPLAAPSCDLPELLEDQRQVLGRYADPGRLLQVIGNLLTNALKFTPDGGRVLVSAKPDAGEMVFAVSDTGPGMSPDDMDQLFDRFWQARDVDSRGIGLGLTISKGIVEAHGGRIWVESTLGEGSTFSYSVPAIAAAIRAA